MTEKVDFEDLDASSDGLGEILLRDLPFTGIAYEYHADTGLLLSLAGFYFGKYHGPSREWRSDGTLIEEVYHSNGARHGPWREWHSDGSPKVHAYWECDEKLWWDEWDDNGNLIKSVRLDAHSEAAKNIEDRLGRDEWKIVDIDIGAMEFLERPQGWCRDLPPDPA